MEKWWLWLIAGLVSLFGGFLAFANPFAASIAVEIMIGWVFLFTGILGLISAFSDMTWQARTVAIIWGLLLCLVGINLLTNPVAGLVALTFSVAILMIAGSIFRIMISFREEFKEIRWFLLLPAILSMILAIMILSNFPQSAAVVFGIYLAIELISNGVTFIFIAFARKRGDI